MVLLKGPQSVVAAPDGRASYNTAGSPALATAGSGDVLAGMLGAFFAQQFDLVSATLGAVYLHGAAAEGSFAGFTAGDIAPTAAGILDEMRANFTR